MEFLQYMITPHGLCHTLSFLNIVYPFIPNSALITLMFAHDYIIFCLLLTSLILIPPLTRPDPLNHVRP